MEIVQIPVLNDNYVYLAHDGDATAVIDPAVAEQLFDRFFRSDASHSRTIEGTGLGLAIVRSIARVHGGRVNAAPRPEGGSVFRVVLPTARETIIDR